MSDWMFETATTAQPTIWDDPALGYGESNVSIWQADGGLGTGSSNDRPSSKGELTEFDLMVFNLPEHDIDDIDVYGEVDPDPYDDPWETGTVAPGGGGGPSEGTGGSGGGQTPSPDPDNLIDCGDAADGPTPANVNINDIRDKAREVAQQIANERDVWEWGAIIYMLDGQLHSLEPVTQENPDGVGFNYGTVPNGAHIVAWVHSHTWTRGDPDQYAMSDFDTGARERMVAAAFGRYTVDPALMTYVLENRSDDLLEFGEDDDERDSATDVTACGG